MARKIKVWWNHEDFDLVFPFFDDEGPCRVRVKPGGSFQLDDRYTRYQQMPDGSIREHVDGISPHLRPDKPKKGAKRKVEVVVGVNDKGYAKTEEVEKTTPAPKEEPHTIEDIPPPFNPNFRTVQADQHQG